MTSMSLKNKVAVVTASTSGIGLATALKLAENDAIVYLAARNKDKVQDIIDQHKDLKLKFVYFDATIPETFKSFIQDVYKNEKRLDILVNNFGSTNMKVDKTIFETQPEDFINTITNNLNSMFIATQEAVKIMKEQNSGSIINISSIGSLVPDVTRISYATTKVAINGFTQNVAVQTAKYGIRVNAVLPGLTHTNAAMKNLPEEFLNEFLRFVPVGRMGEPDDIANMVLYLASDLSTYITGEIISVAGAFGKPTPLYGMMYSNKK